MTVSTRLPKPARAKALLLHEMLAHFEERRMVNYVELMRFNGKLLRWTKPHDSCFDISGPGFVANDIGQLGRVKRAIRHHLAEMEYEGFKMEEIVQLAHPGLSRQAFEQGQLATGIAIAARCSLRSHPDERTSAVRDSGQPKQ